MTCTLQWVPLCQNMTVLVSIVAILCDMMYIIQLGAQVPHTMQLNCGQSNGFYSIPYII